MHWISRVLRPYGWAVITLLQGGCGEAPPPPEPTAAEEEGAAVVRPRYTREYLFVGSREGEPLVAQLHFEVQDRDSALLRTTHGWLAAGAAWDSFLEQSWSSSAVSGVWQVLPHEGLRVGMGAGSEPEAFWYRSGERSMRLEMGRELSTWSRDEYARFRLLDGALQLGAAVRSGTVLEVLQVEHRAGAEPREGDFDWIFLTSGDSLRLLVAEALGGRRGVDRTYAWTSRPGGDRTWERAEVRWTEMQTLEEARRDIPTRWSYRIPEAGITGELEALGRDVSLGPDRGGRRAVEARFTVRGWLEVEQRRVPVTGVVRHVQG